jgi:signal transduction histidine kinase
VSGGGGRALAEDALIRRARRGLAIQSALAVTLLLALVIGVLAWGVLRAQDRATDAALARAAGQNDPDDLAAVPPGTSVFVLGADGTVLRASPRPPAGLPDPGGMAARPGAPVRTTLTVRSGSYRTYTSTDGGGRRVQAAVDLGPQAAERRRLLTAVLLAALAGVAGAMGVGLFIGRRVIAPLGDALERQGRFVADASHELRTPVTLLSTRAQMLARDAPGAPPEQIEAEARSIASDAARLDEIIEDLLLSAQPDGGPGRREQVDLDTVAAEAIDAARPQAGEAGVSIDGALRPAVVLGAPTALRRVVDALLDNALRMSPPGSRITVTVDEEGGRAVLAVTDHGAGFDEATGRRLFERFAHAPDQPGRRARFGIGLSLVREVVTAHGGQVEAISDPAGGATFTIRLPGAARDRGHAPRKV